MFSERCPILGEKINLSSILFWGDNMVSRRSQWYMVVTVSQTQVTLDPHQLIVFC
jgi:hypothetical protein